MVGLRVRVRVRVGVRARARARARVRARVSHLGMALPARQRQGGPAALVLSVDRRALVEQQLHHLRVVRVRVKGSGQG